MTDSPPHQHAYLTMLRELLAMIALCYFITLGLLRCIAQHLDLFFPPASAGYSPKSSIETYQRAIASVSRADVLKITASSSVLAFTAMEICVAVMARASHRVGDIDPECGVSAGPGVAAASSAAPVPEKSLEKPYFGGAA
ncbi:hypothetical protein C8R43DRAFT_1244758 [Mycena crocata]|nr:hypothetical protein C8R43DRAFT_1244758 [Mycena crocata]